MTINKSSSYVLIHILNGRNAKRVNVHGDGKPNQNRSGNGRRS